MDFHPLLMERDRRAGEGILHLVLNPADWHAGRLHGIGFLPVLRFLGSHASAYVLANRDLGWSAETLRGDQVFSLYLVWLGADAAGHSIPVFPPPGRDRRLHLQHSRVV